MLADASSDDKENTVQGDMMAFVGALAMVRTHHMAAVMCGRVLRVVGSRPYHVACSCS